jgi:2-amino-4-hydroxy-6-hydroxymethyldihydropteridine diphosphokinase
MNKTVYLSLGSNVGDREAELRAAMQRLDQPDFRVTRSSSVYETEPVGYLRQGPFLNIVIQAETPLFPMRLLGRIENIERAMGRKRVVKNGPRNIDIDILLFGPFVVETGKLEIPHPRMTERRFVLEPLIELAPDLRHPVTRKPFREYLAASAGQFVRKTALRLDAALR